MENSRLFQEKIFHIDRFLSDAQLNIQFTSNDYQKLQIIKIIGVNDYFLKPTPVYTAKNCLNMKQTITKEIRYH